MLPAFDQWIVKFFDVMNWNLSSEKKAFPSMLIMLMVTVSHSKLKLVSQYDAGTSVASWASGWHWNSLFQRCVSQHPANQIVEKFNIRNIIWVVEKNLFPVTLVTRMAPASYYEPGLCFHFYDQSINVTFKQHMYMYLYSLSFFIFLSFFLSLRHYMLQCLFPHTCVYCNCSCIVL